MIKRMTDKAYVEQIQKDLLHILGLPEGQRLMEFLEDISGFWHPGYDPANETSVQIAAGRREVVLTLKTLLKLTPEQVVEYFTNRA